MKAAVKFKFLWFFTKVVVIDYGYFNYNKEEDTYEYFNENNQLQLSIKKENFIEHAFYDENEL